jgi:hypothetical protein
MVGFLGTLLQGPAKDLLSQRRGGQRSDAGIAGRRSVRKDLSLSFIHAYKVSGLQIYMSRSRS